MKKSINISVAGKMGFHEGLKIIKDAGFEAVELNLRNPLNIDSTEDEVKRVRDEVLSSGLEIASLLGGWYMLTSGRPDVRKEAEEELVKGLKICKNLGTDSLLVVPGAIRPFPGEEDPVSYDTAYERSLESIKRAIPAAEEQGVCICVENVWNKFLLSPVEMKRFIEEINSEYARVYFDVGNVLLTGFPEMWIRILGTMIKRIHLKDFKTSVGNAGGVCCLLEGDVNWPGVAEALKETGYDSYLTAEYGPYKYYPETILYHLSLSMDKIMGRR